MYLNDREIFRSGITNATVNYLTYTPPAVTDDGTIYQVTNVVAAKWLVAGTNILAVEIHQDATNSSDISFDLMLWAQGPQAPMLSIVPKDATHADIAWPLVATGYTLKSKANLNPATVWNVVTDPDAPANNFHHVTVDITIGPRFYRLEKP